MSNHKKPEDLARAEREQKKCLRNLEKLIAERIERLPECQRKVLALHCAEGLRLGEIAEVFGMCRSHVGMLYAQAIQAVLPTSKLADLTRISHRQVRTS